MSLCVQYIYLLVCMFAAEITGERERDAVAMESYPWCRRYGNKAWKASDLIGISEALWNCDPE